MHMFMLSWCCAAKYICHMLSAHQTRTSHPEARSSSTDTLPDSSSFGHCKCREGAHPEHCSKLHMTNCGKFDLHVKWELKSQPTPVTPAAATGKAAAKPKAAKEAAAQAAATPIFLFEPKV